MPIRSERHPQRTLWTPDEAVDILGMPLRTLRRTIAEARERGTLYEERIAMKGQRGRPALHVDLLTLGLAITPSQLAGGKTVGTKIGNLVPDFSANPALSCQPTSASSGREETPLSQLPAEDILVPPVLAPKVALKSLSEFSEIARRDPALLLADAQGSAYRDTDPEAARQRYVTILPVLSTRPGSRERGQEVRRVAQASGADESTVRDWVTRYERDGLSALQPQARRDRGAFRLPQDTLQLICAAVVTNPPTTSTRKLHQTLVLAVPDAMLVRRAGKTQDVSVATVARIRDSLLAHPQLRLMLMNADARKEFLRTYVGRVIANHANDMWQLDMTRCDVLVYDEETDTIYRPRVQAIIDVYSGCIPGIGFSPDEDQVQADLALFRALLPKNGPLATRYPIYGKPRRIYIDNGKTYSSEHFERVARDLGIEMIHSRPYVSHTRGKVERFFGTLHTFERTLPGYVGYDAADRGSEELDRLTTATRRWRESGRDPGEGRRLMTLREYQDAVLRWLIVDYHETVVDGRTRVQWFTESAPRHSLVRFDLAELMIHFARRSERVVRPDCTVSVDGTLWACEGGELGAYAGSRVLVLHDVMALGPDIRMIALRERAGHLRVLGAATRAPDNALSIEAGELRRANKLAKRSALADADELGASLTDPALLVRKQHERQLPVVNVQPLAPSAQARLTSVTPEPKPDLGDFGKSFLKPDMTGDMQSFMTSLLEDE